MATRKLKKPDNLQSLGDNPGINSTRSRIKGDKNGLATFGLRLETLIKDKALKLKMQARAIAEEVKSNEARGGEDLKLYSQDYMVDHEFTKRDKKLDKPITINGKEPKSILRKVSNTEEYNGSAKI